MRDSLRARLLFWHTAILLTVVALFGGAVCYLDWQTRIAAIDGALAVRLDTLADAVVPAGPDTFDLTLTPDLLTSGAGAPYHVLWTDRGELIDRSDADLDVPRPTAPGARTRDGRRELAITTAGGVTVLAGQDLDEVRGEIWALAALLLVAGTAVVVLSLAGGWLLAGRALAPIERINQTAQQMSDGDLAARIPVERVENELEQVARALNHAFDQLQASIDRQRRLTGDISHELRTPLTALSTEVQWALNRPRSIEEYRESLAVCQRAAARMLAIVERLLSLARGEADSRSDQTSPVRLDEVVANAVQDLSPLANSRALSVSVEAAPFAVLGDADRLLEAVTNIVSNAIRYNVDRGRIGITMVAAGEAVELAVADSGVGIAAADLPRIFDPFFRTDPARSRDAGGAGLGLAVARAIVEQHRGTVECESEPGRGTTVRIRLPLHQTATAEAKV